LGIAAQHAQLGSLSAPRIALKVALALKQAEGR